MYRKLIVNVFSMRLGWVSFALLLGLCDARRAAAATTEEANFLEKRLAHPQISRQRQGNYYYYYYCSKEGSNRVFNFENNNGSVRKKLYVK